MTEYRIFIADSPAGHTAAALWPVTDVWADSPELALAEVCGGWAPCRVMAVPVDSITAIGWGTPG